VLTIPANKWLTVSGTLTSPDAASLVIESGGSLKHITDNVPATIKRVVTGSTDLSDMLYHFVSVPLTAAAIPVTGLFVGSYLFDFVESTNNWHSMGTEIDTPLDVTKGYMMYYPGGASTTNIFAGPMNNGTFTAQTGFTDANPHGYNLVPNPYPSAIDWLAGSWVKTNINNAIYIWPAGAAAASVNYASFVNGVGANGGTQFIPVGQSFFVRASGAAPVLMMDNTVRVHNAQAFWKSDEVIPNVLRIHAFANNATDETVIRFTGSATANFDSDYDAYKLQGGADAPQLNSVAADNSRLCINSLSFESSETIVPLDFTLNSSGEVSITVSDLESFDTEVSVFLEDKLLNTMTDLRETPFYNFTHNTGFDAARFTLHFYGVNGFGESTARDYHIWAANKRVNVHIPALTGQKAIVELYDLLGHLVVSKQLVPGTPGSISVPGYTGIGMVRIISGNQIYSAKVFVE
jgi:hypothetical protein